MGPPGVVHSPPSPERDEHPPIDVDYRDGSAIHVDVSTENEATTAEGVFTSFLTHRLQRDGHHVPQWLAADRQRIQSATARELQRIGDQVNNNATVNNCIAQLRITDDTAYETFAGIATKMFDDGVVNWGRVVMLFMFAYKLALRVIENKSSLVYVIISWVVRFVKDRLAVWIATQGGWSAIAKSGATIGQTMGVFLAGVAVSTLITQWRR